MDGLQQTSYAWYSVLSQWASAISEPLLQLLDGQTVPAIAALLLGILGGLAPCQVSANVGAIAYVTKASQERQPLWRTVGSFLGGKAAVYVTLGLLAAFLGLRIPSPALALMRKLSGPIMIVMGLYFLGLLTWRSEAGARLTEWLKGRLPTWGSPAFWLGAAFSLGFCPTMALIFFGRLVPLTVEAEAGLVLPVLFTVGTALPVILWAMALSAGREMANRWVRRVRVADRWVRWGAAAVFLVLGLNDTVLYWFL
ncbi:MAG TPA: sulfite exporter TauE/SafE family protein [Symbiobacteriaceae bacterium]|nr:sulfite exporter TauE/SafE family protein [Symbiobacteriaceae bacterium]